MARLNLSIPDELDSILTSSAKSLDRSEGYIVRKAIIYYLQELQDDMEDAEIALARMNSSDKKTYTSEEVRAWLKENNHV